jgi:hypothetical protein
VSFNVGEKDTTGNDYKTFLNEFKWFTKKYNPEDIYHSLRCGLVHQFIIKNGKFMLTHNNSHWHLKIYKNYTVLNYQNFFEDIKNLKKEYFSMIEKDDNKRRTFLEKFNKKGFLVPSSVLFFPDQAIEYKEDIVEITSNSTE